MVGGPQLFIAALTVLGLVHCTAAGPNVGVEAPALGAMASSWHSVKQDDAAAHLKVVSARSLLADAQPPSAPPPPTYPGPPAAPPPAPPAPPLTSPALPMQQALLHIRSDLCPAARVLLPDWSAATDPCLAPRWSHISCGLVDGRLLPTAFDFVEMSLTGTLPPSLSGLTSLQELNLATNAFSGTLPPGISALTNLLLLDVSNNNLTGSLPASFSALTNLQQLSLGGNHFTGSLPASWSTLVTLAVLDLSDMAGLTGALPSQWSSLSNMSGFDASGAAGLCGPLNLGASSGTFSSVLSDASSTADSSLNQTCPSPPPPPLSPDNGSSNIAAIVAPSVIGGLLVLAAAGGLAWYVMRKRREGGQAKSGLAGDGGDSAKHFTELATAPTL